MLRACPEVDRPKVISKLRWACAYVGGAAHAQLPVGIVAPAHHPHVAPQRARVRVARRHGADARHDARCGRRAAAQRRWAARHPSQERRRQASTRRRQAGGRWDSQGTAWKVRAWYGVESEGWYGVEIEGMARRGK